MARIIRLTESDLARIVRRVIKENPDGTSTIEVKRGTITLVTNGVETIKTDSKPTQVQPDTKIINASSDVILILRDGNYVVMVNRANCPNTGVDLKYLAKKYDGQNLAAKINVDRDNTSVIR